MVPFQWIARTFGPRNKWMTTVSMAKMDQKVQGAIVQIMSEAIGKQIKCHGDMLINLMTKLSCAAAEGKDCFEATMESDQGDQTIFAKTATKIRNNAASINVSGEAVDTKDGHGKLKVTVIPEDQ